MLAFVRERESEFAELLAKKNERDLTDSSVNAAGNWSKPHNASPNWTASSNGPMRITSMAKYLMTVLTR